MCIRATALKSEIEPRRYSRDLSTDKPTQCPNFLTTQEPIAFKRIIFEMSHTFLPPRKFEKTNTRNKTQCAETVQSTPIEIFINLITTPPIALYSTFFNSELRTVAESIQPVTSPPLISITNILPLVNSLDLYHKK